MGHWMHDVRKKIILRSYSNHADLAQGVGNYFLRRRGRIDPEVRLYISYFASLIMALALLILGFALQRGWHYMVVTVFYGVQVAGIMIATTAVNAYLLDAYPEGSGEVGAGFALGEFGAASWLHMLISHGQQKTVLRRRWGSKRLS